MAYTCKLVECYPGFGPELLTDGDMEDDPTNNWTAVNAAMVVNTVNVHGGCRSLRVTATANNGNVRQDPVATLGQRYRVSAWGLSSAAGHRWRMRIFIGASCKWTGDWHDNAVAWEQEVKFYRMTTVGQLRIRLEIETSGESVYFDDASITQEPPVSMTEIDLQYNPGAGFSLRNRGIVVGRPERVSLYGGRLQLELVRQDGGKRIMPLRLTAESNTGQDVIDRINALEEMLRHAARHRTEGWGGEVFLEFKIDDATLTVWFPVCEGEIDTGGLYEKCGGEPDDMIKDLPVWITCQPEWEANRTYDLSNLLDNPGFEEWNGGICDSEPDCWTDFESIAAGTGENYQETNEVLEGCEALRIEVNGINNLDYKGVYQNIQARLRADTEYTLLAWVHNDNAITNGNIMVRVVGSVSGTLGTALASAAANTDYTQYSCQFTPAAADVAGWVRVRAYIVGTVNGCIGTVQIDKMLVMEASAVPTGWMSSSYLVNHYDRDAGDVNYFSVCDIPGGVEAEIKTEVLCDDQTIFMQLAKKTRDNPCAFVWQLIPCEAYTTAEGGAGGACTPGLTSANCIDSDKIIDATSPSGSRITVTFAGDPTMVQRCRWDISGTQMRNYQGKFMLCVIAKRSNATDTITMSVEQFDNPNSVGLITNQDIDATAWTLYDGWELFSYRLGQAENAFGVADELEIRLYAETDGGGAPATELHIAGAFLVPLDEGRIMAGDSGVYIFSGYPAVFCDMDGRKGVWSYRDYRYYASVSWVGQHPTLTPEVENWHYFYGVHTSALGYTLDDDYQVSIRYRPRGVFLRGTNP